MGKNGANERVAERPTQNLQIKNAFAGGVSGAITRSLCQPLDVLKIRFQLQVEPFTPVTSSKYTSMLQAVRLIVREEGLWAMWKGHTPAQVLSIAYGTTQFWTYERLKVQLKRLDVYEKNQNISNFMCGAVAGGSATIVSTPLDVIRTRLIAQDNKRGYSNSFRAGIDICRSEGIRGCYRGLVPSIMQVTPLSGINFMIYNFLCKTTMELLSVKSKKEIPPVLTLINGGVAGILSKSTVYPLDLTKKRMQIQGFGEHHQTFGRHFVCKGFLDCFTTTVRTEGFLGLYKGMTPSIFKSGITMALLFSLYDNIMNLIS